MRDRSDAFERKGLYLGSEGHRRRPRDQGGPSQRAKIFNTDQYSHRIKYKIGEIKAKNMITFMAGSKYAAFEFLNP